MKFLLFGDLNYFFKLFMEKSLLVFYKNFKDCVFFMFIFVRVIIFNIYKGVFFILDV